MQVIVLLEYSKDNTDHKEASLDLVESVTIILYCLPKSEIQGEDEELLQDLKEEAEPDHLAGNVDSTVWWKIAKQADPDCGVDGGEKGLEQQGEVEPVLNPWQWVLQCWELVAPCVWCSIADILQF